MAVYLYTGNGGGKTTNALGIAMRSLAHGKNVLMIQFLKWDEKTGEVLFAKNWEKIIPRFIVKQYGRKGWHGFKNLTYEDENQCLRAKAFSLDMIDKGMVDVLILDEVNLVEHLKLLSFDHIKDLVDYCREKNVVVVMTGRHASKKMKDLADIVNEVREIKAPKEMVNEVGVQW